METKTKRHGYGRQIQEEEEEEEEQEQEQEEEEEEKEEEEDDDDEEASLERLAGGDKNWKTRQQSSKRRRDWSGEIGQWKLELRDTSAVVLH